ncbi:hypothetical protein G3O08_08755 [Cryomorpha ignava]|uniref:Uncharacterized protein n=1 Tax=Cryomorpha ignava TaxID=101383 RepID=A0A7K3WPK3_9FLAO|nr:hypothetical protein [Cryomorpha ignava]NEN23589.1 hypothetical protein [Cryomorpha ignava]
MKTLLIYTSIFLFSVHAYPQTQPYAKSLHAHEGNLGVENIGTDQQPIAKPFLAERYLGKSFMDKFEHYLKTGSVVRNTLEMHEGVYDKDKISQDLNPASKSIQSKFYFKMVKGEWKSGFQADLSFTPVYATKSVLCLTWNKADGKNRKSHFVFAFGDFRVSK